MAKKYTLVEGDLHRRGANGILMWCITLEEGCQLLIQQGFYWPTTIQDAVELVKTCGACHFRVKQIHTPML
jgi:hypothetical protein